MKKYFGKFEEKELFTEHIFSLMKEEKDFMVLIYEKQFTYEEQLLVDEEVDEYIKVHGIMSPEKRIMYHCVRGKGYAVHYTDSIYTVSVPNDLLNLEYEDFLKIVSM